MAKRRSGREVAATTREAARWFLQLRDGDLEVGQRRRYVRWLKDSPGNVAEALRISRIADVLREAQLDASMLHESETSNIIDLRSEQSVMARSPHSADGAKSGGGWHGLRAILRPFRRS